MFVIHGRDEAVRERMFDFLRALDLKPLEWEALVAASGSTAPFLGDVIQRAPALAWAALVLLTPDDVVNLHPALHDRGEADFEIAERCQPRPNVLIELGMVLTAYPERAIIVEFGRLRPIADLAGRNVIRFDGSAISLGKLAERLKSAGCTVDTQGSDWRNPRRFEGLDAYDRVAGIIDDKKRQAVALARTADRIPAQTKSSHSRTACWQVPKPWPRPENVDPPPPRSQSTVSEHDWRR